MKAMVLAAGQGTRLRPLTDTTPKALVPVAGRPMIEYSLLLLRYYGIRDIIVNLHHLGDQIEAALGNGEKLGLRISYSREQELLDTGGGILKAKSFLSDGTFIVINTDILIDLRLADVIAFHQSRKAVATLVLRADPQADRYGSIDIDATGQIVRFLDAHAPQKSSSPVTKLMFTGVQVLEPEIFRYMESLGGQQRFGTTKHVYPRTLADGEALYGFRFDGFWSDLGTLERIQEAESYLKRGRAALHFLAT
jgi:NDP-sugar pyrophosphorylase family protein